MASVEGAEGLRAEGLRAEELRAEGPRAEGLSAEGLSAEGLRAIPFIQIGFVDSELPEIVSVTEEAKSFLSTIEGPISIISTVGLKASGKSQLLNRVLLPETEAFLTEGEGSRGLTLWPQPLAAQASDGTEVTLLVVDTEGLEGNRDRDLCILSLSLLLSSYVVYVGSGGINDEAVESLWSLVSQSVDSVKVNASDGDDFDDEVYDIADFMPKLMWTFKDSTIRRKDENGRPFSSKVYLEKALEEITSGIGAARMKGRNATRAGLKHYFPDRDCFPLGQLDDGDSAQEYSPNATMDSSRSTVPKKITVLRDKILHNAEVKMLYNAPVSGGMVATLAECLVNSFNSATPLSLWDSWCTVSDVECDSHMQESLSDYEASVVALRPTLPMGASDLSQWYQGASQEAMDFFLSRTKSMQAAKIRKYKERLELLLKGSWERLNAENWKVGCQRAHVILEEMYRSVEEKLHSNAYTDFMEYERDRRKIRATFIEQAPKHHSSMFVLNEFMEDAVSSVSSRFINKMAIAAQDMQYKLEDDIQRLQFDLKQERAQSQRTISGLMEKIKDQEDALSAAKDRERAITEQMLAEKELHSDEIIQISQNHSRALQEALMDHDELLREKAETDNALAQATEKVQELSDWKKLNSSQALWDAERSRVDGAAAPGGPGSEMIYEMEAFLRSRLEYNSQLSTRVDFLFRTITGRDPQHLLRANRDENGHSMVGEPFAGANRSLAGQLGTSLEQQQIDMYSMLDHMVSDVRRKKGDLLSSNLTPVRRISDSAVKHPRMSGSPGQFEWYTPQGNNAMPQVQRSPLQGSGSPSLSPPNLSLSNSEMARASVPRLRLGALSGDRPSAKPQAGPGQSPIDVHESPEEIGRVGSVMSQKQEELASRVNVLEHALGSAVISALRIESAKTAIQKAKQYTEYKVRVVLAAGYTYTLSKRYNDFRDLHEKLMHMFPFVKMPLVTEELFGGLKSSMWFNRFDPEFIECRRIWLQEYMLELLKTPQFTNCKLIHKFLEAGNAQLLAGPRAPPIDADAASTTSSFVMIPSNGGNGKQATKQPSDATRSHAKSEFVDLESATIEALEAGAAPNQHMNTGGWNVVQNSAGMQDQVLPQVSAQNDDLYEIEEDGGDEQIASAAQNAAAALRARTQRPGNTAGAQI